MMDESPVIRILIVENFGILRDGLRKILESEPGFCVIGEATGGAGAVKAASELKADILLLDVGDLPQTGLEFLREVEISSVPVRTILLAAHIDKGQLMEALHMGVRGVVRKQSTTDSLIEAIREVMAGRYWLGVENVSALVNALLDLRLSLQAGERSKNFGLTAREMEIVETVATGFRNKEIARMFSLSEQTVKHHLTRIFAKVGVSSRLELALFAVNRDLVRKALPERQRASIEPWSKPYSESETGPGFRQGVRKATQLDRT